MPARIVIDADPGQDDAVALLLAVASDELELCAVTAVAGNVPVAQTAANARRVLDLAGSAVPVHQGATAPLLLPLETAEFVCGPDGLAGADLPPPSRGPDPLSAAEALIRLARAPGPPLTICALGPLTNLALALRLAPDIAPRLARIVLMGGARDLGNMTPAAEFNFYVDPHAAAIVLDAGVPVVMFGLHVTHQAVPGPGDVERIAGLGTATGRAVAGMLTRPRAGGLGTTGHPMHDPCVVAWLLWPDLFTGRDCRVEVETTPGTLRGRSTIDWNNRLRRTPNAHVLGWVDAPGFWAGLIDRLARLP